MWKPGFYSSEKTEDKIPGFMNFTQKAIYKIEAYFSSSPLSETLMCTSLSPFSISTS